ncbi:MAG: protein phosphatase 2C domain-containing protein [Acidimicrobiia bacterium]
MTAVAGPRATLLVIADGHNGFESAEAAVSHVLDVLGDDPPAELDRKEFVQLFHDAGEAVLAVTRRLDCPNRESRTTLVVALVGDRQLRWAAMGDSALFVAGPKRARRLDTPRSHFVGYPMTLDNVRERLPRGVFPLDGDEWVILVTDGFTDFLPGSPDTVSAATVAASSDDAAQLARDLMQRSFAHGAADNVAVAVAAGSQDELTESDYSGRRHQITADHASRRRTT